MAAKFRVMIVDDNVFYAEAVRDLLKRERHHVVGVEDRATSALTLAERDKPDLALVDVNLGDGRTGFELGRKLAASGVGVVFVSGEKGLGSEVLRKPAGDARLLRAIDEAGQRLVKRRSS